jgi:hypothetical protein
MTELMNNLPMIEILTGALVLITGFYAWATYQILKANKRVVEVMQEQNEAISRPYVTVSPKLEADNPIFYLTICNSGRTAARNLRLTIDRSFYKFGENNPESDLATCSAFTQPIDAFAPGSEMTFSLAQGFVVFAENADESVLPKKFTVVAEYEYGLDRSVKESHTIDLRPYLGADVPQEALIRKMKDLIKAVEKVATSVKKS